MDFLTFLNSGQIVICDGAGGTNLDILCRDAAVTKPKCNEELNIKHPELVQRLHEEFLRAGANVMETNTFSANRIVLAEHGLEDRVRDINVAAVNIAREAIKTVASNPEIPRFISGDLGPTSKLPTLGHISFDEMVAAYKEQAEALLEAGIDLFQIDTCQDILQIKAAIIGCREAIETSRQVDKSTSQQVQNDLMTCRPADVPTIPIIVTMTIEPRGTTLLGTELTAALSALSPYKISAFGLNCATGPAEMEEHIRQLSDVSPFPIAVLPNAGLPEIKNGRAHYPLAPDEFAEWMEYFVRELGVRIAGGCCGTTPEHIAAMVKRVTENPPNPPLKRGERGDLRFTTSSLYSSVSIDQEPRPLLVGERMNINGSKEFREYILADNYDAAAAMAKKQADSGAHVLDLSVAYAGRDEIKDIKEMSKRLATASPLPIMVDSTNPIAIETALSCLGGRSIINSINLENGEERALKIYNIARRYGAALVALTIDEEGMAWSRDKKLSIAKRLINLCKDCTVFIDFLAFTLADPKAAEAGSGRETLEAIKQLKQLEDAGSNVRTILGISNISYGLKSEARRVLNSVFLNEAVSAGLDAAIVHAKQILPLHKIEDRAVSLAMDLIYCKSKDALSSFIKYFEASSSAPKIQEIEKNPRISLQNKIMDGDKAGLAEIAQAVLKETTATDIINQILLPTMQKVGEMFGAGRLALPFVLQSAETLRAAVDLLTPHLGKAGVVERGSIVIATVRGDVHDIGKNLVDIILTNNGYRVINLGVKQPVELILKAAGENKVDAIGLSGLLVQSCMVMQEDLAELSHRGITTPIICGGAALTRKFVENELQKAYKGRVYYAKDAFDGLKIMNTLAK